MLVHEGIDSPGGTSEIAARVTKRPKSCRSSSRIFAVRLAKITSEGWMPQQ